MIPAVVFRTACGSGQGVGKAVLSVMIVMIAVARSDAQQRVWRDASGTFTVTAQMLGVADDRVRLRKEDGSETEVPLARLSAEDQAYVKEHGAADAPPPAKPGLAGAGTATRRVWKDESGDFSVEADLVSVSDTAIELRKADGSVISVPLGRLSQDDRTWLRRAKRAGDTLPGQVDLESVLRKNVSVNFAETPLSSVASQLSDEHGIGFYLDERSLGNVGLSGRDRVTFQARNQTLENVLRDMLSPLGMAFTPFRNEVVLLSEEQSQTMIMRVYRIRNARGAHTDFDTPISQIQAQVTPDSWEEVGGPGTIQPLISPVPCLVISQSYSVHREMEERFPGQFVRTRSQRTTFLASLKLPEFLDKPVSFSVANMPLAEFPLYLSNTFAVPVELDRAQMGRAGIDPNTLINGTFSNVRLVTALDLALRSVRCKWTITDDRQRIRIHADAETPLITHDYRIAPIVGSGMAQVQGHLELLKDALEDCSGSWFWGPWAPASITITGRDTLTIRQTVQGHLAICDLLDQLLALAQR